MVEFGKHLRTVGFDISHEKVALCRDCIDPAGELPPEALRAARLASYTHDSAQLGAVDVIVVAVPTPVDAAHRPDFGPLERASESVGRYLKRKQWDGRPSRFKWLINASTLAR